MTADALSIRSAVRGHYASIASSGSSCCTAETPGYEAADLAGLPEQAIMGLGCGNPVALASIAPGETVLDLGSGGGLDVFLAARRTGPRGRVIGADMTPEMLRRAEANAASAGIANVEFREGLIEELPVADASVDVVLSNCVINLAPDKAPVFAEVLRVLRPGGRMVVSDIVRSGPAPEVVDPAEWASCIDGALPLAEYLETVERAGFEGVEVLRRDGSGEIFSITLRAVRP